MKRILPIAFAAVAVMLAVSLVPVTLAGNANCTPTPSAPATSAPPTEQPSSAPPTEQPTPSMHETARITPSPSTTLPPTDTGSGGGSSTGLLIALLLIGSLASLVVLRAKRS